MLIWSEKFVPSNDEHTWEIVWQGSVCNKSNPSEDWPDVFDDNTQNNLNSVENDYNREVDEIRHWFVRHLIGLNSGNLRQVFWQVFLKLGFHFIRYLVRIFNQGLSHLRLSNVDQIVRNLTSFGLSLNLRPSICSLFTCSRNFWHLLDDFHVSSIKKLFR